MIKFKGPEGAWLPVFAWRPVRDRHGAWHWLTIVYRRELNQYVWPPQGYEYGAGADVLMDTLRNA